MKNILLGVNIDHVATLRQARRTRYPEPVQAALIAEQAGADSITLHMREDLRHIQARDVRLIKQLLQIPMNLELAVTNAMLDFAEEIMPKYACFVPEKRAELTTEGGLDVIRYLDNIKPAVSRLQTLGCQVSLFIDPDIKQIDAAVETQAIAIEIHTGCYADMLSPSLRAQELERVSHAAIYARSRGLIVNAGHGLNYQNVKPIAAIAEINELNIGHAIIARAIFSGLEQAVVEMRRAMLEARMFGDGNTLK